MSYTATGRIVKVFDTENKSGSFKSREFVIETKEDKYPQLVKFQLVQDRCDLIDQFLPDQEVTVHFDLRGKEWQNKYFTTLNAWKIE